MSRPCCTATQREQLLRDADAASDRVIDISSRTHQVVQPPEPRVPNFCGLDRVLAMIVLWVPVFVVLVAVISALVYVPVFLSPVFYFIAAIIAPLLVYLYFFLPDGDTYLRVRAGVALGPLSSIIPLRRSWPPQILMFTFKILFYSGSRPSPETAMSVDRLRPKRHLRKDELDYALNLTVANFDEEEFYTGSRADVLADAFSRALHLLPMRSSHLPMYHYHQEFGPDEDPVEWVMGRIGDLYPALYEEWHDKQSDEALARVCVASIGAHRLEKVTDEGKPRLVVRTNALARLPVRDGLGRYGGDCYLDLNYKVIKIVKAGGRDGEEAFGTQTYRPGDPDWDYVKFVFRSSLFSLVTFVDHLFGLHLLLANAAVVCTYEGLAAEHPIRRFLTVFLFRTVSVNDNAANNLVRRRTMGERNFAFTSQALTVAWASAPALLQLNGIGGSGVELDFERYYGTHIRNTPLDTPFRKGQIRFWRVLRVFIERYIQAYYPDDAALAADEDIPHFLLQLTKILSEGLNISDLGSVTNGKLRGNGSTVKSAELRTLLVSAITRICFEVTLGHEHLGTVGVYAQDVSFAAFHWLKGRMIGTKPGALHQVWQTAPAPSIRRAPPLPLPALPCSQAALQAFTATPMPLLMVREGRPSDNWSFLFPEGSYGAREAAVRAFDDFQEELRNLSATCEAEVANWRVDFEAGRRKAPDWPIWSHDPKYLECSVSV